MTKKIRTYITIIFLFLCQNIMAQNKTPTPDSPSQTDLGIFALPPFERAVRCIKYYEGWHDIKRNYPYIGWGHRILPHEKFKKNLTYQQADSLLRSDLTMLCAMFRKYGKDSLLLAVLAYNVGPYKPKFGISDSRFSCYARFPIGAYYIYPPNNMDGKMQNCKVQMKFTL